MAKKIIFSKDSPEKRVFRTMDGWEIQRSLDDLLVPGKCLELNDPTGTLVLIFRVNYRFNKEETECVAVLQEKDIKGDLSWYLKKEKRAPVNKKQTLEFLEAAVLAYCSDDLSVLQGTTPLRKSDILLKFAIE